MCPHLTGPEPSATACLSLSSLARASASSRSANSSSVIVGPAMRGRNTSARMVSLLQAIPTWEWCYHMKIMLWYENYVMIWKLCLDMKITDRSFGPLAVLIETYQGLKLHYLETIWSPTLFIRTTFNPGPSPGLGGSGGGGKGMPASLDWATIASLCSNIWISFSTIHACSDIRYMQSIWRNLIY